MAVHYHRVLTIQRGHGGARGFPPYLIPQRGEPCAMGFLQSTQVARDEGDMFACIASGWIPRSLGSRRSFCSEESCPRLFTFSIALEACDRFDMIKCYGANCKCLAIEQSTKQIQCGTSCFGYDVTVTWHTVWFDGPKSRAPSAVWFGHTRCVIFIYQICKLKFRLSISSLAIAANGHSYQDLYFTLSRFKDASATAIISSASNFNSPKYLGFGLGRLATQRRMNSMSSLYLAR